MTHDVSPTDSRRELDALLAAALQTTASACADEDGRYTPQWERLLGWASEAGETRDPNQVAPLPPDLRVFLQTHPSVLDDVAELLQDAPWARRMENTPTRGVAAVDVDPARQAAASRGAGRNAPLRLLVGLAAAAVLIGVAIWPRGEDTSTAYASEPALVAWLADHPSEVLLNPQAIDSMIGRPDERIAQVLLPQGTVIRQPASVRWTRPRFLEGPLRIEVTWMPENSSSTRTILSVLSGTDAHPWPPDAPWPEGSAGYRIIVATPDGKVLHEAHCAVPSVQAREVHRKRLEALEAVSQDSLGPWLAVHYAIANGLWSEAERLLPALRAATRNDAALVARLTRLQARLGR